jgi:hypothetical protein
LRRSAPAAIQAAFRRVAEALALLGQCALDRGMVKAWSASATCSYGGAWPFSFLFRVDWDARAGTICPWAGMNSAADPGG